MNIVLAVLLAAFPLSPSPNVTCENIMLVPTQAPNQPNELTRAGQVSTANQPPELSVPAPDCTAVTHG